MPTADEIAEALVERLKRDPEVIYDLFRHIRVSAAVLGCLTTAEKFRALKGLPGASICKTRYELYSVLIDRHVMPEGAVLEFGVAAGESARFIGNLLGDRPLYGFDSFEGLPEPWHEHQPGEYSVGGQLPEVPFNVTLIKGWFQDTLDGFIDAHRRELERGIAFLHLDADIYSATKYVLQKLRPFIRKGTVISFDEFWNTVTWEHDEYRAWTEFLAENPSVKFSYIAYVPHDCQLAVRIDEI